MEEYLNKTIRELKLRNYSPKTIKAYLLCIELYLKYKKTDFHKLNEENIKPVRIDTPLKFSQLQILKPESRDGKLELWSKTKGEESSLVSQKTVKF